MSASLVGSEMCIRDRVCSCTAPPSGYAFSYSAQSEETLTSALSGSVCSYTAAARVAHRRILGLPPMRG
eukprot:8281727-Alexandrium_andersonii.AAC.1